jgi:hypothetical protein
LHRGRDFVEHTTTLAEVDTRRGVVVITRTDAYADGDTVAHGEGKTGKLLGQDRRRVKRGEQDIAHQRKAGRCSGCEGQRDDRVNTGVDEPVDGCHRLEAALLGASGPFDHQRS